MRTLVVYYSRTGLTRKVAGELAEVLGADTEEIKEQRSRAGPIGWLISGREGREEIVAEVDPPKVDPSFYDMVVVCTPVWGWNMSSPVRGYLTRIKGRLLRAAFIATMDGDARSTFANMAQLIGVEPVATQTLLSSEIKAGTHGEKLTAFAVGLLIPKV